MKRFAYRKLLFGLGATTTALCSVPILAKIKEEKTTDDLKKHVIECVLKSNNNNKYQLPDYNDESIQKWDFNWDKREPMAMIDKKKFEAASPDEQKAMLEKVKPTAVRHIFLIRHGQYDVDADDPDEKKLTPLGREQATLLGKRLANALERFNFQHCTFSTMMRARETGQLITKEIPDIEKLCKLDGMLEEGPPFPPEPPNRDWRPREHKLNEHGKRIEAAFSKYFHRASPKQKEDSYELIVGHANVIRYFVCRALQYPPQGWLRISLANTSITWLMILPDGRVILKALGDFGHLPPEKLSFT